MSAKIRILIAEHDPVDLELLHHELKAGKINYVSEVVQNEHDYINALKNFIPDIILADYTFPSFGGPAAFKIKEEIAPDTPFIFVSGTIGEEKSIEHIKTGVTDYALKEKLFTLTFKVTRALKESAEKRLKKKIEHELILSERYLARAQQMAHLGSWELNFSSNTVRLSDEACRIYGLLPNQNIQPFESWLSFIHTDDVDLVLRKIKECHSSLPDFCVNYRILNKSGITRYIYSESKLELDSGNKAMGLFGIAHDITETVLLENKLAQERRTRQSEITSAVLKAQESERAIIGTELHENLNQILSVTRFYIELAKTDQVNRPILLEKSVVHLVDVMAEIRKISKILAAPGKHISLYDSIQNLLNDLLSIHPIKIQFHIAKIVEATLNENLQLTIFRIVQEQVNNILKHANATNASITLNRKKDEVILLISDNGEGTDILKEIDGVGIRNIKSRADLHNGTVTIVSKPGKGYELRVALSLTSHNNKVVLLKATPALR